MTRRSAAEWARVLREWRRSGERLADFAKSAGIPLRTLTWWRWRLSKGDTHSKRNRSRAGAPNKRGAIVPVRFVQVVGATGAGRPAETPVEIATSGVSVRVRSGFDGDTLDQVLAALERRRSEQC